MSSSDKPSSVANAWYRRFPFLPLPAESYLKWRLYTAYGEMTYLDGDGAELHRDARRPHMGATHALVLAISYGGREPSGPIARYARGDDYHELLRERVRELHVWLQREV